MLTGHESTEIGPHSPRAFDISGQFVTVQELRRLADRIHAGSVFEWQASDTLGLLVTRDDPRTRWRSRRVLAPINVHWPMFAPSVFLLTGHETACRARRCRGDRFCTGHAPLQLGWPAFAAAYRAELDRWPFQIRLALARQIVAWLCMVPSLTILSFERPRRTQSRETAHGENWAQRHIFRQWVLDQLPLAAPLVRA